jgi:transcriptional regulator with XRE-family HTH domain
MNKHPVTEAMRIATLQAMRSKSVKASEIAAALQLGKPWVTKFLSGKTRFIQEESMHKLEDLLGVKYFSVEKAIGERSPLANKIAALVDTDPLFARTVAGIEEMIVNARCSFTPRYFPTKDMTRIGQEIIRICFANEDKPGKVAREVLKLLA